MKKNQLKLKIWNSLNGQFLSSRDVEALIAYFNDDELGAFVDLCANNRYGKTFLCIQSGEKGGIAFYADEEVRQMLRKYLDFMKNSSMAEMQKRVYLADLDEIIYSLAQDVEAEHKCGRISEARAALLDYCRGLRAKQDCPSSVSENAEGRLFELLKLNYEGALLYDAFTVFYLCIDELHSLEKLATYYGTHNLALEVYVQEFGHALDVLFQESCL